MVFIRGGWPCGHYLRVPFTGGERGKIAGPARIADSGGQLVRLLGERVVYGSLICNIRSYRPSRTRERRGYRKRTATQLAKRRGGNGDLIAAAVCFSGGTVRRFFANVPGKSAPTGHRPMGCFSRMTGEIRRARHYEERLRTNAPTRGKREESMK